MPKIGNPVFFTARYVGGSMTKRLHKRVPDRITRGLKIRAATAAALEYTQEVADETGNRVELRKVIAVCMPKSPALPSGRKRHGLRPEVSDA